MSYQFTAGGANSLRGYTYDSIGPGKILALLNVDLQQKIYEQWQAFWFFDIGTVTSAIQDTDAYIGTGPGISWSSVIGDAKLSIGRAVKHEENAWKIQFNFTPNI